MPHIIIEFSHGLAGEEQIESMLDALHTTIAATDLFETSHIRIRACPQLFHRCGGNKQHFMHAQMRIHTGRDTDTKRSLSDTVLATLRAQQWPAQVITVEVVEMDREGYAKFSIT